MKSEDKKKLKQKLLKIALEEARKLKADKNVEAVVLFGSLVHGKVHSKSDIDLKVYCREAKQRYKTYKIRNFTVSVAFNNAEILKNYERDMLINLLFPYYPSYEDVKAQHIHSRILFDRNGQAKKYYSFMRKMKDEERIYLLTLHLRRAKHYISNCKYLRDKKTLLLNIEYFIKEIISVCYLLNNMIRPLYKDYNLKKLRCCTRFSKFVSSFQDKPEVSKEIIEEATKYLDHFLKSVLKYIKKVSTKVGWCRTILKSVPEGKNIYYKVDLLYDIIREFYLMLLFENLTFSQLNEIRKLMSYNEFLEYRKERDRLSDYLVNGKIYSRNLSVRLLDRLAKTAGKLYEATKSKKYYEEMLLYLRLERSKFN